MVKVNDITITSLETITAFDITTGNYLFELDELQNASIAQTQDTVDLTGKQGRKISSMKRNKAVTISGASGIVSAGLFEMQTGSTFENKVTEVMWSDYLTVTSNAATTTYTAVGTEGAEIVALYVRSTGGIIGDELAQADAVAAGKFTYNPETKALAFNASELANGTEIVVRYKRKITADVLSNESDVYSSKCSLYIDAFGEDKCANIYRVQFYIPKADFNGNFTFDMGDNQTIHNFEAEALAGSCGVGGQLWTYTVFGADTEDAAD